MDQKKITLCSGKILGNDDNKDGSFISKVVRWVGAEMFISPDCPYNEHLGHKEFCC